MKLFGTSIPSLTKFCDEQYNIKKSCNTIRLGTLFNFRTEENEKLRDEGEGEFSYKIEFPKKTEVSFEWLNAFEVDGAGNLNIGEMSLIGNKALVKDIEISGSSHNCWIYCLSKAKSEAGNITDAHGDSWSIPMNKLPNFAHHIASLLMNNIKASDLPKQITDHYSIKEINERLSISIEINDINYTKREIKITSESELSIEKIKSIKSMIPFTKPERFTSEQEVRIAFWLNFENNKISIENNNKIINLRAVDSLIS